MNTEKACTIRRFNRINDEITSLYHRASTKLGMGKNKRANEIFSLLTYLLIACGVVLGAIGFAIAP